MSLEYEETTYSSLIRHVTGDFLGTADPDWSPEKVEHELLTATNISLDAFNQCHEKGERMRLATMLVPYQMAQILIARHHAVRLYWLGFGARDNASLALYHADGPDEGIYDFSDKYIGEVIGEYCPTYTIKDVKEVIATAMRYAPAAKRNDDPNLIAVNNGIFDYQTKMLMDFDPEIVFTSKSHVDYVDGATNPHITMPDGLDWDVESWMESLSDDEGIVNLLWQMVGSVIRPNVRWDKAILLCATSGNNGKGTLCQLMRNICGEGTYASISVKDFGKEFMLSPLMSASSVIVDENDTDSFLSSADAFKAAVTHDVLRINIKMKEPKDIRFTGVIIECVNALPRFQDKSGSLYRRLLTVPMTKCFTGIERKYIKSDYLGRSDVLEYVLYRVLNMNYENFDEPDACKTLLREVEENNDPVRQFLSEVLSAMHWNGISWKLLFDLYVAWYQRCYNKRPSLGRQVFMRNVRDLLYEFPEWEEKTQFRAGPYIKGPEPLLAEYWVESARDISYHGLDRNRMFRTPEPDERMRGIVRDVLMQPTSDGDGTSVDDADCSANASDEKSIDMSDLLKQSGRDNY